MKHLSVTTKELPTEAVRQFICAYTLGDDFTPHVDEVDCLSCYKQIVKTRFNLKEGTLDEGTTHRRGGRHLRPV